MKPTTTAKERLAIHDATKDKNNVSKWHVFVYGRKRVIRVQEFKRRLLIVGCLYADNNRVIDFETPLTNIAQRFKLTPYQPPAKKPQTVIDTTLSWCERGNTLLRDGDGQFVAWLRVDGDLRLEIAYSPDNYPKLNAAIRKLSDEQLAVHVNLLGGWIVDKCNCPGVNINDDGRIPYGTTDENDEPADIRVETLDYTGTKPEVFFMFNGTSMSADLDPGVVNPVVVHGSAVGMDVDVEFYAYRELQKAINVFAKINTKPE
jgi:hypothetical protein